MLRSHLPTRPSTSEPAVWCLLPPAGMRLRGGRELNPDPYMELVPPPSRVTWLSGVLRKGVRLRLRLNHGDSDRGRSFWQLVDLGAEPERTRPHPSKPVFFLKKLVFLVEACPQDFCLVEGWSFVHTDSVVHYVLVMLSGQCVDIKLAIFVSQNTLSSFLSRHRQCC